jgi:hypothetical protein
MIRMTTYWLRWKLAVPNPSGLAATGSFKPGSVRPRWMMWRE